MYEDQINNSAQDQANPVLGADQTAPTMGLGTNPSSASASPAASSAPITPISTTVVAPTSAPTDDLITIRKKALDELSPLVSKLNQSPEEKYKTLMMMIQASDNQHLLQEAYEAAQKITDEKVRAEALLNIVNEINYFTQKSA
jgi:hypothetical protein